VLEALSNSNAMTAGEVAAATGLGRGTVSTTLTKLANSGEVRKAERGYTLPTSASTGRDGSSGSETGTRPWAAHHHPTGMTTGTSTSERR
jgi:hypothetical protein